MQRVHGWGGGGIQLVKAEDQLPYKIVTRERKAGNGAAKFDW